MSLTWRHRRLVIGKSPEQAAEKLLWTLGLRQCVQWHNRGRIPQDAQKGRSARLQPMRASEASPPVLR